MLKLSGATGIGNKMYRPASRAAGVWINSNEAKRYSASIDAFWRTYENTLVQAPALNSLSFKVIYYPDAIDFRHRRN